MSRPLIAALAVVFLAAGVLTVVTASVVLNREEQKPAESAVPAAEEWRKTKWIEEFTLTERSGKRFDSRSMEGEVWVVSFFFASCPVECVNQNNHVAALQREFGPQDVTFVSITCDPETDTPARLRDYANRFQADADQWLFLTGDLLHIKRIAGERFSLGVDKSTHSSRLVVVDRQGEVRGRFQWEDPVELTKLKLMLKECLEEQQGES